MCSVMNDFLGGSPQKFSEQLFQTASLMFLIPCDCSLQISRTPFSLPMPCGKKGHGYLSKLQNKISMFKYVCPFVITSIKGLKHHLVNITLAFASHTSEKVH